ncbi:BH3-only protein sayonara isoform X2 [Lycorma delicatula]|uniref:BH3-only protein sayonara isoform X2 n=1 Tax=Lycorma delicatula TaxID=130591 RepID=UPI003F5144B0
MVKETNNRSTSRMGCTPSGLVSQKRITSGLGADLLDTFLRIDRDIWREEKAAPAPSLGHCMARLEKLNNEIERTIMDINNDQTLMPGAITNQNSHGIETADDSIRRTIAELRINRNSQVAIEHEEFIANLTRKALKQHCLQWLTSKKKDTEEEIAKLSDKVHHLQRLYEHQDTVLSDLVGSATSELEIKLDRVRSYRDTLYAGELIWREAAQLTQAAAELAKTGSESWSAINTTLNSDTRFCLATDCRNSIQEAALCIQTAQSILLGVEFPYCTTREINALLQVIEYLYTDMQVTDRYTHGLEAYSSFQKRAYALHQWIRHLMEQTIRKDVLDVDQKITELSSRLCSERANLIRQETGFAATNTMENGTSKDLKKTKPNVKKKTIEVQEATQSNGRNIVW